MKIYRLCEEQELPISTDKAWEFFSSPFNLSYITPPGMNFRITNHPESNIYSGMLITYKISPIKHIPVKWVTEIVNANKPDYFIDEQRFGPYKFWHHRHSFTQIPGGTLIKDEVHYALPYGVPGQIINYLLVKNRLKKIFAYRKEALNRIFTNKAQL